MDGTMTCATLDGWLPIRIWPRDGEWRVDWCWFGDRAPTRPFFRDDIEQALRLPFNQAFRRETAVDALLDWQRASPGLAPGVLIFHASRCGSTLLAQMLAGLPRHTVLSEPPPLDAVLRAHYRDPGVAGRQADWVRALFSAYGQRRLGGEGRLLVKLDAWNVFEASLLCGLYPDTPRLFLYRDPLEIVVSQLRQPGMQRVPGLLGPSGLDEALPGGQDMPMLEYSCRMVGQILERGLRLCREEGGIALNYTELPGALWGRLGGLFGVREADLARLQEIAAVDAKQPSQAFSADSLHKRESATEAVREAVRRWAQEPYDRLEALRLLNSYE
ncbi:MULTISPECIES: sulfotransferase family protein [Pseudomonas]|uniref:sulfotransferase family protein n=1 Tax=Pseudomonas TaxID=286 RepID=UPI002647603E|nr:sulfotransferase family protein [Pseudomonas citronellolis]MDN6873845.1 sulfotransferase family protein [Pseudomonas citronellolis]